MQTIIVGRSVLRTRGLGDETVPPATIPVYRALGFSVHTVVRGQSLPTMAAPRHEIGARSNLKTASV